MIWGLAFWNQRVERLYSLWSPREEFSPTSSQLLATPNSPCNSLACSCIIPISAYIFRSPSSLCVWLSFSVILDLGSMLGWPHSIFTLLVSAKTYFQTGLPPEVPVRMNLGDTLLHQGFPGGNSGKEPICQCRRHKTRVDPWVGKISWRRAWQPTAVFLPGESYRQSRLAGYSLRGCKEVNTTEATFTHYCTTAQSFVNKPDAA